MASMKDLARILGVELWEEFEIDEEKTYRLTDTALEYFNVDKWRTSCSSNLIPDIITGKRKITRRKSWSPGIGNRYYYVNPRSFRVDDSLWGDTAVDNLLCDINNCFRTREDAEAHKEDVLNRLKSTYKSNPMEAAKIIKNYCTSREKGCINCPYCSSEGFCDFDGTPSTWSTR